MSCPNVYLANRLFVNQQFEKGRLRIASTVRML